MHQKHSKAEGDPNHVFNVVFPSVTNPEPYKEGRRRSSRVLHSRVLLIFSESELVVCLSYGSFMYVPVDNSGAPTGKCLTSFHDAVLHFRTQPATLALCDASRIRKGRRFHHNGLKYEITTIVDEGCVICKHVGRGSYNDDSTYTFNDMMYVGTRIAIQLS